MCTWGAVEGGGGEYLVGFRTQKGIGIGEALALDAGRDLE